MTPTGTTRGLPVGGSNWLPVILPFDHAALGSRAIKSWIELRVEPTVAPVCTR